MRTLGVRRLACGILLLLLIGSAAACGSDSRQRVEVRIDSLSIRAELARTPDERTEGLSGRDSLAQDAGMLFVFPEARPPAFWMKQMRFPLDFVWISADRRVVEVTEDVPPPAPETADSALPLYTPSAPVQYVLEVNAGTLKRAGVRDGDAVTFQPEVSLDGVR